MTSRNPLIAFNAYAARQPSKSRQAFTVAFGIGMTVAMLDKRGALAGLIALLVYGFALALGTLNHEAMMRWSHGHPRLDQLLFLPLCFLALAYNTNLELRACAAISAGALVALNALESALRRSR